MHQDVSEKPSRLALALVGVVAALFLLQVGALVRTVIAGPVLGGPLPPELLVEPDPVSDSVAATAAEFRVDESGAATYTIPLYTVPGTAGVAPKLALHYSSQLGEGSPLGKGWSIQGLSSIARCRATREAGDFLVNGAPIDGNPRPVELGFEDRFCLDGQRLVPSTASCPAAGGMTGVAYATEIESFQRICAYSSDANGPAFFTVERKDGSISWYGDRDNPTFANRPDGYVNSTAPGKESVAIVWAQTRFQDSTGNYIDFLYSEGSVETDNPGEHLISRVRYTGKVVLFGQNGSAQPPYAEIAFNYAPRIERRAFIAGGAIVQRHMLESITSSVDHDYDGSYTDVRHYALTYGSGMGMYGLTSLQECNNRHRQVCAAPTTFQWSTHWDPGSGPAPLPFETQENTGRIANGSLSKFEGLKFGDIDGDGRQDMVWMKDAESGGSGCQYDTTYVSFARLDPNGSPTFTMGGPAMCAPAELAYDPQDYSWFLYDYTGDGRDDIFFRGWGRWVGYRATGNLAAPFDTAVDLLAELTQPIPVGTSKETEPQQADLNGDGLIDLVYPRAGAFYARLTERGGMYGFRWGRERLVSVSGIHGCSGNPFEVTGLYRKNNHLQLNDFDGDARSDLLLIVNWYCGGGGGSPDPGDPGGPIQPLSTTASAAMQLAVPFVVDSIDDSVVRLKPFGNGNAGYSLTDPMTFADINGDGLTDVIFHGVQFSNPAHAINTGKDFGGQYPRSGPLGPLPARHLQVADVNGDGRADLLFPNGDGRWFRVAYGTSAGNFAPPVDLPATTTLCGDMQCVGSRSYFFQDIDGDGNADFMRIKWDNDSSSPIMFSRSTAQRRFVPRNVITRITNGFGAITEIAYGTLNNQAVHRPDVGTRNTAQWGRGSPVQDLNAPMYVVTRASSSAPRTDNPNAMATVHYRYAGAKVQAGGRGFLGFAAIETIDANQNGGFVVTQTRYAQNFPFTGMPVQTSKRAAIGQLYAPPPCLIGTIADSCFAPVGGTLAPLPGNEFSHNVQSWEVAPASLASQAPLHVRTAGSEELLRDPVTGAPTSKVLTAFTYGANGNVAQTVVDTYTGSSLTGTVVTQNTYHDDVARWRLGRLTATTVTHRRPGVPDVVRTTSYGYAMGGAFTGLLTEERVQPGGPADQALTTVYGLDEYGNRVQAVTCAAPAAPCDLSGFAFRPAGAQQVRRYSRTVYDARGRFPIATYEPFWTDSGGQELITSRVLERDAHGNVVQAADVNGVRTVAHYGAMGRAYFSQVQTGTDGGNLGTVHTFTRYRWCGTGSQQVACPEGARFRQEVASLGAPRKWVYFDVLGRPVLTAEESFNVGVPDRDVSATCTIYDGVGRPHRVSNPFFLPGVAGSQGPTQLSGVCASPDRRWTVTTYDVLGRPTSVQAPDSSTVLKQYDGLVTVTTNPRGKATRETRNGKGELLSVRDAEGGVLTYAYNADGTTRSITRHAGAGLIVNAFVYDALGRKIQQTDPDTGTTTFAYNALGELLSQVDNAGFRVEQRYDARGRVWQKTAYRPDGHIESQAYYDYDQAPGAAGRLIAERMTDATADWVVGSAFVRTYRYDALGRPSGSTTSIGDRTFHEGVLYDRNGRPWQAFDASGRWTRTEYTVRGHVAAVCVIEGMSVSASCPNGPDTVVRTLATDAWGHVTHERRGDSAALELTRDYHPLTGRLAALCGGDTATCSLMKELYGWDAAGNLHTRQKENRYLETFTYDGLDRLIEARLTMRDGQVVNELTLAQAYDALGNVCSRNGQAYDYAGGDGCGAVAATATAPMATGALRPEVLRAAPRTAAHTVLWQALAPSRPAAPAQRLRPRDALDAEIEANDRKLRALHQEPSSTFVWRAALRPGQPRPTPVPPVLGPPKSSPEALLPSPHAVTRVGAGEAAVTYGYDARGHQILRDAPGTTQDRFIAWTAQGQAADIRLGSGARVRFWYGPDGQRYRKDEGGTITLYLGNVEVVIQGGATTLRRTVAGVALQTIVGEVVTTRYLFHDALGSLVRIAAADGTAVERHDYAAFGARRGVGDPHAGGVASAITPRGFTGHEHLDGVDVIHMNGRIYDPRLGRFLQPDPLIQAPDNLQSWNAYSYVFNNPLRYTDPTGLLGQEERQWLGAVIMIAAMVTQQYWAAGLTDAAIVGVYAAAGFVSGAIATKSLQGGLMGAFTAALTAGLGGLGGWEGWVVQSFTGGVLESLQGGDFGHGFLRAGLTAAIMPQVGKIGSDVGRTLTAALVGGTISELTGGKFANGAITAALIAVMKGTPEVAEYEDQLAARRGNSSWTPAGVRRVLGRSSPGIAFLEEFNNDPVGIIKFDRATDTYINPDGTKRVQELPGLQGSYDPRSKVIRLNAALTNEQAAVTLYHEYRHYLGANEENARILTEQFAIDAKFEATAPGYRTSDNQVDVEAIRRDLAPGGALSRHYSPQQRMRTYYGERNVSF